MTSLARALLPLAVLAAGASAAPTHRGVDLTLVSDCSSIQPGQPFRLGVQLRPHEGYHTYWQNPGIVGMATTLKWTLPEGFSAGPIQWPHPEIVDMAGHPAHGFKRSVLLVVEVTPPRTIADDSVTIGVRVDWMACARTCHPGSATLSLTLPVAAEAGPSEHLALFEQADDELPVLSDHFTTSLLTKRDAPQIQLLFTTAEPAPEISNLYFFSTDGQVSSDQPQLLKKLDAGRYVLTLTRSEFGPKGATSLPGVLEAPTAISGKGQRFALVHPRYPDQSPTKQDHPRTTDP